jgi:hypothetical protein
MKRIVFSGEFISVETGEEEQVYATRVDDVTSIIRKMKDGDSLVLNAYEQESSL